MKLRADFLKISPKQISSSHTKDRHTGKWNRMKSPEINPHVCQMIFDKGVTMKQGIVFSTNGAGKTGYPYAKE